MIAYEYAILQKLLFGAHADSIARRRAGSGRYRFFGGKYRIAAGQSQTSAACQGTANSYCDQYAHETVHRANIRIVPPLCPLQECCA